MDTYLTEALVLVEFLVCIAAWVDSDNSSFKFEFNWLKILPNFITVIIIYPNLLHLILMHKSFNFHVLLLKLLPNANKYIVPYELRELDWDVAWVNQGYLGFLTVGHVVVVVEEVIDK